MQQTKNPKIFDPSYHLVFEGQDEFGSVQVLDHGKNRSMHFGSEARQSEMLLSDPYYLTLEYTRLMAFSLLFCPSPKSVLFLGLGGGSLPKFFWKYIPSCKIDIVERSSLVIELCYRYFNFPKSKRIKIHEEDAFEFLEHSTHKYDLIFVDLYNETGISETVVHEGFFKGYRHLLKKECGYLILNLWKKTVQTIANEAAKQIGESFGNKVLILPNKEETNYVFILSSEDLEKKDRFRLVTNAQALKVKTGIDFPQMLADFNFLNEM